MADNDWGPTTDTNTVRFLIDQRLIELGVVTKEAVDQWHEAKAAEIRQRHAAAQQSWLVRPHGGPVD